MPRHSPISETERSMICKLYRRGIGIADLADRYGRHEITIRTVLRKARVKPVESW